MGSRGPSYTRETDIVFFVAVASVSFSSADLLRGMVQPTGRSPVRRSQRPIQPPRPLKSWYGGINPIPDMTPAI